MTLTASQRDARRQGLGGSDAAVVCGLSPFKSAYRLYLEKRGELPEEDREEERLYWGSHLEEPIARRYAGVTGRTLRRQPQRRNPRHGFMLGNIDRQICGDPRGPGVLEVKSTHAWNRIGDLDELPDYYYLQLQHYLVVFGYDWGAFAVLIGGQEFRHFDVERDQETIDMLIEQEREFWRRVQLGDPPPLDGSPDTAALLKRLHPQDDGGTICLAGDQYLLAAKALMAAREAVAEAEAWKTAEENRLKAALGDHAEAIVPGFGKITWRTAKPTTKTGCDLESMRKYAPAIYSELVGAGIIATTTTPGSRRFLLHPDKDGAS